MFELEFSIETEYQSSIFVTDFAELPSKLSSGNWHIDANWNKGDSWYFSAWKWVDESDPENPDRHYARCYSPRVWSLVEIVNLTPHTLDIHDEQGNITTVPTSGQVARVSETRQYRPSVAGLPVVKIELGQVENLPAPEEGKIFIISLITLAAVKDRPDVYAPGPAIRDEAGKIVGCLGLSAGQ